MRRKKLGLFLTVALMGAAMLVPASVSARTPAPTDEPLEIIGTDLRTGETIRFVVQGNEDTPDLVPGYEPTKDKFREDVDLDVTLYRDDCAAMKPSAGNAMSPVAGVPATVKNKKECLQIGKLLRK